MLLAVLVVLYTDITSRNLLNAAGCMRSDFSHFINMDSQSFTWYLVAAESRPLAKQSGVTVCRMFCTALNSVDV